MSTSSAMTVPMRARARRRRSSRLLGAVVLATVIAAPTQTSAAVAAGHHHASHSSCPAELRRVAATMHRLTGHVVSCSEAAALLRKNT